MRVVRGCYSLSSGNEGGSGRALLGLTFEVM